ncbi:unnamed protein product [Symbiodinium natans]|uniref:Uncharacterized protein n=1 Tax=Symbiodinium natans TaxID=878477 RepID=A0A812IH90_9DINO|nr:unnamed protein product [Symbiodinium natans]
MAAAFPGCQGVEAPWPVFRGPPLQRPGAKEVEADPAVALDQQASGTIQNGQRNECPTGLDQWRQEEVAAEAHLQLPCRKQEATSREAGIGEQVIRLYPSPLGLLLQTAIHTVPDVESVEEVDKACRAFLLQRAARQAGIESAHVTRPDKNQATETELSELKPRFLREA